MGGPQLSLSHTCCKYRVSGHEIPVIFAVEMTTRSVVFLRNMASLRSVPTGLPYSQCALWSAPWRVSVNTTSFKLLLIRTILTLPPYLIAALPWPNTNLSNKDIGYVYIHRSSIVINYACVLYAFYTCLCMYRLQTQTGQHECCKRECCPVWVLQYIVGYL